MTTAPVAVLTVGGTIFMSETAGGGHAAPDAAAGARLTAAVLDGAAVVTRAIVNTSSSDVRPHHLRAVLEAARAAVDEGAPGVVLTHGTDTLEESAFLLGRYWERPEPLVLTGAMRPASAPGADGPANLRDAVRTARAPGARGLGVLVVFDGLVHAGDRARKVSTRSVDAFASEPAGALAVVGAEDLRLVHRPLAAPAPLPGGPPDRLPPVPMLIAGIDEDHELLDALPAGALAGVVIAGVGTGHVPPRAMPRLRRLISQGVAVVVATRVPRGGTTTDRYAYPGSEVDLLEAGAVMAGRLTAQTARLLLQVLLADGADAQRIRRAFAHYGT